MPGKKPSLAIAIGIPKHEGMDDGHEEDDGDAEDLDPEELHEAKLDAVRAFKAALKSDNDEGMCHALELLHELHEQGGPSDYEDSSGADDGEEEHGEAY